ncbi:MAG TPA: glycosyltransferase family 4 protein [Longimicrobiales bacterium]
MRILYIVSAYSRSDDDVITPWLSETIRRLRERGVDVEVLAPSYRGLGSQVIGGVRVHRYRYAPRRWEDLTHDQTAPDRVRERPGYLSLVPGYVVAGSVAAARLARSGRFDVLHVHWPIPHGVIGLAAKRASGLPLVSTFHGVELTWTARKMAWLRPFLRRLIRASDAVTANSSHTERLIRAEVERDVVRVPFGAALEGRTDEPGSSVLKGAASSPFRLLFVGRLVERKGLAYLLEAMAAMRGTRRVLLDVVGDGPLRPTLERRAQELGLTDVVRFRGFVDAERLERSFAEADAFVLPAVEDAKGDVEGLGVVLIEAQTHGLPVIASASGGIVDIVLHERTGLLVPPGDAPALAAAIERLAGDEALRARLATAGREHASTTFSWDAITDRLVALYRRLAPEAA